MAVVLIILGVVAVIILFIIGTYNSLIAAQKPSWKQLVSD